MKPQEINYIHNFACWAAARSIQNVNLRGVNSVNVKKAIEIADLRNFVLNPNQLDNYDSLHPILVNRILKTTKWPSNYYGVASKIIAIYFKVSIIIPSAGTKVMRSKIYPPLDAYNLNRIPGFERAKWTNLEKNNFLCAIESLKVFLANTRSNFCEFESQNLLVKSRG